MYLRQKNCRRSRPPSAADFLCCFGVLNTIISWESKIKYTHIEYISWNIFFPRSNYVFKNRFLMNFAEFWEFGRLGVGWPANFVCGSHERYWHIEVRDSRKGYFIPVHYGLGLLPDGRVVGASPSASSGPSVSLYNRRAAVFQNI